MTGMSRRGRPGACRATAEFGLSLERCTLAGDISYTHRHSSHTVSVLHTGRVCAVCMSVMCAFVRKQMEVEGVNFPLCSFFFFFFFFCIFLLFPVRGDLIISFHILYLIHISACLPYLTWETSCLYVSKCYCCF